MGCTAPVPTSAAEPHWEGGLTLSIGTRKGTAQGTVTSLRLKSSIPPASYPRVGREGRITTTTPGPHLPPQGPHLLQTCHKMPLGGTLLQQFSPAIATRSRETP